MLGHVPDTRNQSACPQAARNQSAPDTLPVYCNGAIIYHGGHSFASIRFINCFAPSLVPISIHIFWRRTVPIVISAAVAVWSLYTVGIWAGIAASSYTQL